MLPDSFFGRGLSADHLCVFQPALSCPPVVRVVAADGLVDGFLEFFPVLDPLREAYGKPIQVNSGFRCLALNKAVKGSATSDHMTGRAADITGGSPKENKRLFYLIQELGLPFDQLIDEKNFSWVHVSYRKEGNRKQILAL